MKVERLDVYDFKVVFTELEFNDIKVISDKSGKSVENILTGVLKWGLNLLLHKQD